MEIWLSIWPVNLSDSGDLDPDWAQTVVTSSPNAVALPPLRRSPRPPPVLTSSPSLPCEGGAEESSSTRYSEWYNGLCIWSCYCFGCGEVIQWHFNRLSAFFAVALVLICRIKTQPVRHWTCCLVVEQRGSVRTARTAAHTSPAYRQGCAYQWQTKVFSLETWDLWWEDGLLTHPTVSEGTELFFISGKPQIFTRLFHYSAVKTPQTPTLQCLCFKT